MASGKEIAMKDRIISSLSYDPNTGSLSWISRPSRAVRIGDLAGSISKNGYRIVNVGRKLFYSHRVAWLLHYGEWPQSFIDHINCDKLDNRIENLREASLSQNRANLRTPATNTTGVKGVWFLKRTGRYAAKVVKNYKRVHLGYFATAEEAGAAYAKAAKELFGEFSRTQ